MNKVLIFSLSIFFNVNIVFAKQQTNIVDHVHDTLSSDIVQLAKRLDNFFGTERSDDESNNTRIRFYTVTTKYESETASTEGNVKLQLVLPKTQKRLRLVVESDDDDDSENNDNTKKDTTSKKQEEKASGKTAVDATTAALRYIVDTAGIRTSFDAGLRFTTKPQIFYKLRFRKNILFSKWVFRPVEQIKWIQDEGHSSTTDLDFDKRLNSKWLFRVVNNISWDDQEYVLDFVNGTSWYQTISQRMGLSYNLRMNSSNTPEYAVNNYSASIGFRQLLYKKWFFWTISPALDFPRENNFHRTPSISVRFDAILGSI